MARRYLEDNCGGVISTFLTHLKTANAESYIKVIAKGNVHFRILYTHYV